LTAEEKKNAIINFVNRASLVIIDLTKDKAIKRGFDPRKISKIEAGDRLTDGKIFWIKVCEKQQGEKSSKQFEFFEDVWHLGYFWPLYIRVTF
jgi:hypothetical protein